MKAIVLGQPLATRCSQQNLKPRAAKNPLDALEGNA